jgi:UDP-N-acetyl-2-amino-2-deoxyglucuronate dehydrogenase
MKNFALIGAAGFIAPRHLRAIKETGNTLVAAMDKFDSVGVMDSYFPNASFFVEFERFDRHLEKMYRNGNPIDYLSICSPNYLHDSHIRFGLRHGAAVICEKPLVLNPWNVEALDKIQKETGRDVYNILQLRLHPDILALKRKVEASDPAKVFDFDLAYITSRGNWYYTSWKGDVDKSGGIATNIGIHFFDMLLWIFGAVKENIVHVAVKARGQRTYRSITLEGTEIEFSEGFTDLHTKSYQAILDGKGFNLTEALPSIELAHAIRSQKPAGAKGEYHPFVEKPLSVHPFAKANYSGQTIINH